MSISEKEEEEEEKEEEEEMFITTCYEMPISHLPSSFVSSDRYISSYTFTELRKIDSTLSNTCLVAVIATHAFSRSEGKSHDIIL